MGSDSCPAAGLPGAARTGLASHGRLCPGCRRAGGPRGRRRSPLLTARSPLQSRRPKPPLPRTVRSAGQPEGGTLSPVRPLLSGSQGPRR
eukprot:756112-Hanusia_phi.AAC.1